MASHIQRAPGSGTVEASWEGEVQRTPRLAAGEASLKNQDKPLQEAPDAFKWLGTHEAQMSSVPEVLFQIAIWVDIYFTTVYT